MPLANVALTDTFDIWRIRTNQLIYLAEGANDGVSFANTVAQKAFDKANSANLLALSTGIISNAFTSATIAGANTAVGAGANAYAATVGTGANAFATAAAAGANAYMIATQNGSNTAIGAGANAYAVSITASIGVGANAFASATIAGANSAVGAGANTVSTAAFARANAANLAAGAAFDKANTAGGGYYIGNNGRVGSVSGKNDIFRVNNDYIDSNIYFSSGENGSATGPITVNPGFVLQVNTGARVVIL